MRISIIVIACIVALAVIGIFIWRCVQKHRHIKKIEQETGVKHKRRTFREFWEVHKPSKRRLIQVYAALLYNSNIKGYISGNIYTGESKFMCVPGLNCYSCPGAIGACPLGAFQNALAESRVRAPYYVIGILAIFGLTLARTVCGWLCPVGLGQELLYKIRSPKLRKSMVTRVLSYFKYVVLVVLVIIIPLLYALRNVPLPAFCKYICPTGTIGGAISLLIHPDNASMFDMLGGQFLWKFALSVGFVVASIFIFRFFCRFFCPLGAIYGFFNRIALIGVKVDKNKCTDCGKCVSVCEMDIKRVGDHECINCGKCISACPSKAICWKGSRIIVHNVSAANDNIETLKPLDIADEGPSELQAVETSVTMQQKGKKRDAKFWVQLTAGILAIVVLIGSLVYCNFIYTDKNERHDLEVGYEVGMIAPDFTVELYGAHGQFTLYENRGKLTVINFWATWCTPCVAEIPYFDKLAEENPDITVIAIHGISTRDVSRFIEDNWRKRTLIFAQDNLDGSKCLTYRSLGGTSMWPMTVIVDADGKIVYNSTQSFKDYHQLQQLIDGL